LSDYGTLKIDKSEDGHNIHFEQHHFDEALIYFEKYLQQQLTNHSKLDLILGDTYQILANTDDSNSSNTLKEIIYAFGC
jgi:hypothetical protein